MEPLPIYYRQKDSVEQRFASTPEALEYAVNNENGFSFHIASLFYNNSDMESIEIKTRYTTYKFYRKVANGND